MVTRRKYTIEDELIIAEEIDLHQTNIRLGLMIAAERLHRTYNSVKSHWYKIQSRRDEINCCCLSKSSVSNNRKVTMVDNKVKNTKGLFHRILELLRIKHK